MTVPARNLHNLWVTLASGCAIVLCIISIIPIPDTAPAIPYLDKIVHLCEYWLFAFLLVRSLRPRARSRWTSWWMATAYGALIEGVQAFIPWRSAEGLDLLANAVGAALGVLDYTKITNTQIPNTK